MRKLVILVALSLGACTANQAVRSLPIVGNVCEAADQTLIDEKVVGAAEILYNVPAHAYVTALENGTLTPEIKAVTKPKLVTLYSLLKSIRAAKGTVNCDFASMKILNAEVRNLLPRNTNGQGENLRIP